MGEKVVDFEEFRARKDQATNDQEILRISEGVRRCSSDAGPPIC